MSQLFRGWKFWMRAMAIVLLCWSCGTQSADRSAVVESKPMATTPTSTIPQAMITDIPPVNVPKINADRLFSHIESLAYERVSEVDRDRSRSYIIQTLEEYGFSAISLPFDGGVNIFAERLGTDADAGAILLGAHYDTVSGSPGADDNATGVATVLEVARLLGSTSTPRTLQLAFFDLEEVGLLGSLAFAAGDANPETLRGAIILDMVGFACHTPGCQSYPNGLPTVALPDTGDFLAVLGDAEHLPLLNAVSAASSGGLPRIVALPIPVRGLLTPDLLRSDHAPFWLKGIGAVMVTDTANFRNPNYHQPSDLPETLDRSFFNGAAQIVVNATAALLESQGTLATPVSGVEIPQ
ncbi:MAG: M28 family peptidase [Geitlerinemataceae cyanobacterium]